MDPEIREAIKKRMIELLGRSSDVSIRAAEILIDMEKTSDLKTLESKLDLLQQEVNALKAN